MQAAVPALLLGFAKALQFYSNNAKMPSSPTKFKATSA